MKELSWSSMPSQVRSRQITSGHVTSGHVKSRHVMSSHTMKELSWSSMPRNSTCVRIRTVQRSSVGSGPQCIAHTSHTVQLSSSVACSALYTTSINECTRAVNGQYVRQYTCEPCGSRRRQGCGRRRRRRWRRLWPTGRPLQHSIHIHIVQYLCSMRE
jgi:hypothetical protein